MLRLTTALSREEGTVRRSFPPHTAPCAMRDLTQKIIRKRNVR